MLCETLFNFIINCLYVNHCIFSILNFVRVIRNHILPKNWLIVFQFRDFKNKVLKMANNLPTFPHFVAGSYPCEFWIYCKQHFKDHSKTMKYRREHKVKLYFLNMHVAKNSRNNRNHLILNFMIILSM